MNWTKWSAISEIVSSIAIVVTLVYLAIQVQQSTVSLNAESRTNLYDIQWRVLDHQINKPEIRASFTQDEPLTDEQKIVLNAFLFEFFGQREFMWLQYQSGIVDEQTMETLISDVVSFLDTPRIRDWWGRVSDFFFEPGYVELVNSLANSEALADFTDPLQGWQ